MAYDYTAITELPGAGLTPEQYRRFAQRYALAAGLAKGRRVLEVACGAGSGLSYLSGRAAATVGLDYAAPVLQQAKAISTLPLVQGDAHRLPFGSACFDLILCFEAIYYLCDFTWLLADSRTVLAPGGLLLICQTNPNWPGFVPGALSYHYPSGPELAHALRAAGFERVQLYGGLPVVEASRRQQIAQRIRRSALRSGLLPLLRPVAAPLLRLAYGAPTPLPAVLNAQTVAAGGGLPLTPLPSSQPDRTHQVLYALAWA